MAITTLGGVVAGLQPPVYFNKTPVASLVAAAIQTQWAFPGLPAAGAYDTTSAGVALTSPLTGAMPFNNPPSGNAYLARLQASYRGTESEIWLCDRLWHNGNFNVTLTTAQTVSSVAFPARDNNGSSNGDGVFLAVEVSGVVVGAATPNFTISYTNSVGTAGQSTTNAKPTSAAPAAGLAFLIGLQAGDLGVQSVQSLTMDAAWTSGTINLVAYRLLGILNLPRANVGNALDAVTGGLPRLYNNSVLYLMNRVTLGTNGTVVTGQLQYAFG